MPCMSSDMLVERILEHSDLDREQALSMERVTLSLELMSLISGELQLDLDMLRFSMGTYKPLSTRMITTMCSFKKCLLTPKLDLM